jgi:hypothetical protein
MVSNERRRAQRIEASLAITVSDRPGEVMGRTLDISTNGVYFQTPHFIEPLTKVKLMLMIPVHEGSDDEGQPVICDGVVVRVEPENYDPSVSQYHIAVFFTFVSESSKDILESYIKRRLAV